MTTETNTSRIDKTVNFITGIIALLILLRITFHFLGIYFLEIIFFEFIPKWFLFIVPTTFLVYRYRKKIPLYRSLYDYAITLLGFVVLYFYLTPYYFQKADWNINYKKRNKIVLLAKSNNLKKLGGIIYLIPDSLALFPFTRPNQVIVETSGDSIVTVEFYTDGGSPEYYPRFVYSNNENDLQKFENMVQVDETNSKIESNWYLIHD